MRRVGQEVGRRCGYGVVRRYSGQGRKALSIKETGAPLGYVLFKDSRSYCIIFKTRYFIVELLKGIVMAMERIIDGVRTGMMNVVLPYLAYSFRPSPSSDILLAVNSLFSSSILFPSSGNETLHATPLSNITGEEE